MCGDVVAVDWVERTCGAQVGQSIPTVVLLTLSNVGTRSRARMALGQGWK